MVIWGLSPGRGYLDVGAFGGALAVGVEGVLGVLVMCVLGGPWLSVGCLGGILMICECACVLGVPDFVWGDWRGCWMGGGVFWGGSG